MRRILSAIIAALVLTGAALAQAPPQLIIEAPAALAAARSRIESFDRAPLGGIVRMVGLDEPGASIQVILAAENSAAATTVSPSTAGFAIGQEGLIVIFPSRSPIYPNDSLEDVLRHEVAHVLISRAAGGHAVPRWFHEGLAMAAERPWRLEDRSRLLLELVAGPRLTVGDIDRLFEADASRPRAYVLAGAIVREIIREHGASAPASILGHLRAGVRFDEAMVRAVGAPMREVEQRFWDRQRVWTVWVPLLTSTDVLWMLIIALAALAVWRRRRHVAEIRRRWEAEDAAAGEEARDESAERGDN